MIKIWIHPNIARLAQNQTSWQFDTKNDSIAIGALLKTVFADEPNLIFGIVDESNSVRKHVNIFVGNENIRNLKGLETLLASDGEISIFTAVSGG